MMVVQRNKFFYFILCIIMGAIGYCVSISLPNTYDGVIAATLMQFVIFIVGYLALAKINGSLVSLYGVFLLAFYFFQNGQVLLYSLGVEYNYFYVEKYEVSVLLDSVVFSTVCLCSALAAGVFSTSRRTVSNRFYEKINRIEPIVVNSLANFCWWPLAIVAIPYMIVKFVITSTAGYYAMMGVVSRLPSIFNLVEKLFVGMTVLQLVYHNQKDATYKMLSITMIIWSLLAALTGDRTMGLAGLVTIALIRFTIGDRSGEKQSISRYLMLALGGIVVVYLVSIAFSYRMQTDSNTGGIVDAIIEAIGTLGFSFFPLVLTMRVYPTVEPFMYGKSFIGGFVSGLIPSNFDFLGVTKAFSEWNAAGTNFIDSYYRYGFGLDFSLNAECYINFGWYGWIAMFFICIIIASLLKQVDFNRFDNLFSQYSALILLFCWFTLPRRKSYYIFNHFFWYVFAIGIIILILKSITQRGSKNSK